MSLYSIALFIHIVGAVLVFVLLTVEGAGLRWGNSAAQLGRTLGPVSALAILVPGFYMAAQTGWFAWTAAGLAAYIAIAGLGAYTGIAVMRGRISRSASTLSWAVRAGLAVGVLFDMTVEPDLLLAVAALIGSAALGMAAGYPLRRVLTTV
jgi:hypothetical protein